MSGARPSHWLREREVDIHGRRNSLAYLRNREHISGTFSGGKYQLHKWWQNISEFAFIKQLYYCNFVDGSLICNLILAGKVRF